ncbi:MAG: hypothetical protein IKN24_05415 [Lachnospiraceae bacterium]|nr:hypothetical protein [Lachnospiraceae bacterium]
MYTTDNRMRCPCCGGNRFVEAYQSGYGALAGESVLLGATLYHTVCLECGLVVGSFVKNPEKLIKKCNRKYG